VALIPGVGVAVQFVKPAIELREELGDLLESSTGDRETAGSSGSGDVDALLAEDPGFADEVEDLGADYALDDIDPDALSGEDLGRAQVEPAPTPPIEPDLVPEVPPSPPGDPLADVQDRRRAHRSPARVPARIDAANVSVAGRTRDISETGLLLSADGSELPVGKVVRLEIRHPGTGEPFLVRGKVARHLHGGGTVAAVAVVFDPDPEQEDDLAAVVRAVKATEDQRVARGISGQIDELGMMNLIQMMGNSSPEGTLTASSGEEEGVIAFEDGALRYARLGSMKGFKALVRMLGWTEGHFEFHSQVDDLDDEDEPIPLPTALLEAARQMDEAGAQALAVLPPGVTFTVDTDALARSGGLDKTAEAVVELAMASFTVRRILDVIPESDAEIRGAIEALVESGILDPRPA
jgi:hypothetical protein